MSTYANDSDGSLRIFKGEIATSNELPYVVYIMDYDRDKSCSGGLVHVSWALSAGHCVGGARQSLTVHIVAGLDDFLKRGGFARRQAILIARHPQYKPRQAKYDYLLLKASKPFVLSARIAVVPISGEPWYRSEMYTKKCVAAGWGMKDNFAESLQLRKVNVIARHGGRACPCYSPDYNQRLICLERRGRICLGDSGSLLVCNGKAVGIASAIIKPEDCLNPVFPLTKALCQDTISIFVFICVELAWINKYVPDSPKPPKACREFSGGKSGGMFGAVSDNWDSASIQSSDMLLIAAIQIILVKY